LPVGDDKGMCEDCWVHLAVGRRSEARTCRTLVAVWGEGVSEWGMMGSGGEADEDYD
jgi:hypothetical protein